MNSRFTFPCILIIISIFFVSSCGSGMVQKMNIIFILTDDQRWDALGFSGNELIQTPEMDKLASEGIFFRNAFSTTPICTASRASILTGLYERTHGFTFGEDSINGKYMENSYPVVLKNAGYYTGFYGKFGVEYDRLDQLFDSYDSYDRAGKYKDRRGFFYKQIDGDTVHLTRYTGQQALDFIENVPKDKPFCLSLSFSAPHAHDPATEQYFWQREFDSLYAEIDIPLPIISEDTIFNKLPESVKEGLNRIRWSWRYDTPEKYQHSVKGYYRMIAGVDAEIGKIRDLLAAKKLDKNTIIILLGDNGYFLGERQLAGKWLMYENSLRVPLVIYDPRNERPREIHDLALNIDIPSTILEYAGLDSPVEYQGLSLASYSDDREPLKDRKMFLCEHLWDYDLIPPSEGIRTHEWKYFRYRNDPQIEELYFLPDDPFELNNLVEKASYNAVLNELRQSCDSQIILLEEQR